MENEEGNGACADRLRFPLCFRAGFVIQSTKQSQMGSAPGACICRLNEVECRIVKGVSDFAIDESSAGTAESEAVRHDRFRENVPITMKKIFDDYLSYLV